MTETMKCLRLNKDNKTNTYTHILLVYLFDNIISSVMQHACTCFSPGLRSALELRDTELRDDKFPLDNTHTHTLYIACADQRRKVVSKKNEV